MDNFNLEYKNSKEARLSKSLEVPCNYSEIISARRVKELQVLGKYKPSNLSIVNSNQTL